MLTNSHRIHFLATLLGLACCLLWAGSSQAERFKSRGVSIPDATGVFVQGVTRLVKTGNGAELTLPLNSNESWELLNRVLARFNIRTREQDPEKHRLITGWVLWVWDPDLELGQSKPPLRALSRTYERHSFEFSVRPDSRSGQAVIGIRDNARQREVDITPDSEYSWLQWQDAAAQGAAAWGFLRRLQGDFESALSSRLVPSTLSSPRIIEPVASPAPAAPTVAAPASAPAAIMVAPSRTLPTPSSPGASRPVEPAPIKMEKQASTATSRGTSAPMAVQGGLLVDGGLDATWAALIPAIEALGIELQSSDPVQHMLTTQWISARYEKKNQQFTLESKAEDRWAFNLWGKGRERHRFQLILIPVDSGARTMVYAYHTGFQVETDRTPDSSQTLLYWKDRKTDPAVAMAFLRQLRLVVRQ